MNVKRDSAGLFNASDERRRFIVSLIDLTSLEDADRAAGAIPDAVIAEILAGNRSEISKYAMHRQNGAEADMGNLAFSAAARIAALCDKAQTPLGLPAALCIFRHFVPLAAAVLTQQGIRSAIRLATVVNFPEGKSERDVAVHETEQALALGADEIDLVFPYTAFLRGEHQQSEALLRACRRACEGKVLKVILESGALPPVALQHAAELALGCGADFLKTSTGKIAVGATESAARIMLKAIAAHNGNCGFKASGGVRTLQQAESYLQCAAEILGESWIKPKRFRFGASALLDNVLQLEQAVAVNDPASSVAY